MNTLAEIMQTEKHVEDGFVAVLKGACPSVYRPRDRRDDSNPKIVLRVIQGKVGLHQHLLASSAIVWDTWEGMLETSVTSNRTTEDGMPTHDQILGELRARLQLHALALTWKNPYVRLTDIREDGTDVDVEIDSNLDITKINWQLLYNINPAVWPQS